MGVPAVKVERSRPLRLEPDPRSPTWATWSKWAATQSKPLAVDLFAGGGGLSLGLQSAGFSVGVGIDHDQWAVETHAANFQGLSASLDLSDPKNEKKLVALLKQADVALIAGGPPCQPFSRAGRSAIRHLVTHGRRPAYDDRRDLWRVWLRIVLAVRPRAVLLENVPDMALGDDMRVVRQIVEDLQEAGYETSMDIVEAAAYGVPQHRQRLILVAIRKDAPRAFEWPASSPKVSIWEAISDLPKLGDGTGAQTLPYRTRKRTVFQERARVGVSSDDLNLVYDHVTRAVRDDDRKAFALMTSTTRYSDLPEELRRYRADTFDDKYKRHGKNELARSITAHIAKDGYWYIHPTEERTLTVREAARLQTFPDWYRFAGSRTHAFRQIGNAVPPLLAERIGSAVLVALGVARVPATKLKVPKSTPRHIPAADLIEARRRLDEWARLDMVGAPWRHHCDTWTALLSSVLVGTRVDDGTVSLVSWQFPTPGDLTASRLADVELSPGVRRALRRLLPAADGWRREQVEPPSEDSPRWWQSVKLLPAEAERFACLAFGEDVLLTTQSPLRVAARVTGQPVDRVDRLSDGRLAIGLLVGGRLTAPKRMAAIAALGQSVCTTENPSCSTCPLSLLCASARH